MLNLHAESVGTSAAVIAWDAPATGAAVDHYELFANGVQVGLSTATRATASGLSCSVSPNVLGVEAVDAGGRHSTRATITVTPACGGGAPCVSDCGALAIQAQGWASAALSTGHTEGLT